MTALEWDRFPECGCPCCAFGASAWNEQKDEIKRLRAALEFVRTDPCFKVLGTVTHDTVTDALGLTKILDEQ